MLKSLILNRLTKYTEGTGDLSNHQLGFRKGKSTVAAIPSVSKTAEVAVQRKRRGVRYCALVTLDVKNAFKSAYWQAIAKALQRLQIPGYLLKILGSYFQNRPARAVSRLPQASRRPRSWAGTMYDEVVSLKFPHGVKIVVFTDGFILEVYGESIVDELTASHSIDIVEEWMSSRKLESAHHKTKVTVVNNRIFEQQVTVEEIPELFGGYDRQ